MKFFKKIFKKQEQKQEQTHDEKIAELANQLIIELKNSGRSIAKRHIGPDYGSFGITVHNLGTKNEVLIIHDIINDWEIRVKPTFGEF